MLTRMRGGEDVACKYLKLGILEGSTKELFFFFPFCKSINFFYHCRNSERGALMVTLGRCPTCSTCTGKKGRKMYFDFTPGSVKLVSHRIIAAAKCFTTYLSKSITLWSFPSSSLHADNTVTHRSSVYCEITNTCSLLGGWNRRTFGCLETLLATSNIFW